MNIDDIHDVIDNDPEVTMTVETTLKLLRKPGVVVSLTYYRHLMETYRGWKPLPYEEFRALLRGEDYQATLLRRADDRFEENQRVLRSYRLRSKKSKKED